MQSAESALLIPARHKPHALTQAIVAWISFRSFFLCSHGVIESDWLDRLFHV
jgi:hypothetical protein